MTMAYFWFQLPGLPLLLRENGRGNVLNDPGEEDVFVGVLREDLIDMVIQGSGELATK